MSRARENADGARLDAPLASPAFTGTPTGITAAHLTTAAVLPAAVTGGSGLTALGTVASGNLSNTDIVYPDGHILNSYYFAYTTVQTLSPGGWAAVGTISVFTETKTVNVPAGCSITCIVDGGRSHWGASYGSNHGLQINGVNYENLHNFSNTMPYVPASMTKSVYISGGAASCTIKYIFTQVGSFSSESYLGGTNNTAHMLVLIHKGDIT